jgi:broad specificity phosphatase PhoE
MPTLLTDADIQRFDAAGPGPLEDRDIALHDASQTPPKPVDPRPAIEQRYLGERQKLDKMYQGLAKSNKEAMYGRPPGTLTDHQQTSYKLATDELERRKQDELANTPPAPPPAPMAQMADGGTVRGADADYGPAMGRITKTPISYVQAKPKEPSAGMYHPGGPGMFGIHLPIPYVDTYGVHPAHSIENMVRPDLTRGQVSTTDAHEQIHALLSPNGEDAPPFTGPQALNQRVTDQWNKFVHYGEPKREIPAYMGAYIEGEVPGVKPADAQQWQDAYMKGLPPAQSAIYGQLVQQARQSQMPQFGKGATVQGPIPALVGEAGNEVLVHEDGTQELLDHPQIRQLGTTGTDQVIPLTRPGGDREILRGSSNVPLNAEGHQLAQEIAQAYAGQFDTIKSSPFVRAMQTAEPLAMANPQAQFSKADGLRDMGLGGLEGQEVTKPAIQRINQAILRTPDQPFDGQGPHSTTPGDSLNQFKGRIQAELGAAMQAQDANPDLRQGLVTHNRVLRMIKGWESTGFDPQGSVDTQPLVDYSGANASQPGGVELLARNAQGHYKISKVGTKPPKTGGKVKAGIYLIRHGKTSWNSSSTVSGGKPPTNSYKK